MLQSNLLPPAKEVWGKVMFSQVVVCPQEGSLHDVTSCLAAWSHVPSRGFLPLVPCSFPGQTPGQRPPPPGQRPLHRDPLDRDPPSTQRPPPDRHLLDRRPVHRIPPYGKECVVCILLECILVCEHVTYLVSSDRDTIMDLGSVTNLFAAEKLEIITEKCYR